MECLDYKLAIKKSLHLQTISSQAGSFDGVN